MIDSLTLLFLLYFVTPDSRWVLLGNSYSMGCPPLRGDNPRALANGLSYVEVGRHSITILYHLHQCRLHIARYMSC